MISDFKFPADMRVTTASSAFFIDRHEDPRQWADLQAAFDLLDEVQAGRIAPRTEIFTLDGWIEVIE